MMDDECIVEEPGVAAPVTPRDGFGLGDGGIILPARDDTNALSLHDGFVSEHHIVATPIDNERRNKPTTPGGGLLSEIKADIKVKIFRKSSSSFSDSRHGGGDGGGGGGVEEMEEDRRGEGVTTDDDENQNRMWRLQAKRGRRDAGRIRVSLSLVIRTFDEWIAPDRVDL